MRRFLKDLIRKAVDFIVRVVLKRVDVIKQERPAEFHSDVQAAVPSAPPPLAAATWRIIRTRPFLYPARVGAHSGPVGYPRYFLVTSQGLAASAWLASSLNLHPDITCAMGIDHPLVSMRYYYNQDQIQNKMESIRELYPVRHGFYGESLRQHFSQQFADLGVDCPNDLRRENPVRDLQKMFDELTWFEPDSKYYGNVHVCFAQQALEYLREAPTQRNVLLVNLIRHPVPRTETAIKGILSVATHYQDSDWHKGITEGIDEFAETHSDMRRDVEKQFGVDFREVRNRAVLYSYYRAIHNDCWAGEIMRVPEACHVTIERLMTDRDYFAWLVWELTGREVVPAPEFLDKIYSESHLQSGRHTGKGRSPGPRVHYEAWTEWERHEFRKAMDRLDLPSVYSPFGYDFSFVR
jgi:hypothetical protein